MKIFGRAKKYFDQLQTGKKLTAEFWVPFGRAKITSDPELVSEVLKQPRNMLGSRASKWLISGNSTAVLDFESAQQRRKLFDFLNKEIYSNFNQTALAQLDRLGGDIDFYHLNLQAVRHAYFKEIVGVDPTLLDFTLLDADPAESASLKKITGAMLIPTFLYSWYFKKYIKGRTRVREFAKQVLDVKTYAPNLWLSRLVNSGLTPEEQLEEILGSVSNTHALALSTSWMTYCLSEYNSQFKNPRKFMYECLRMYPVLHIIPTETRCPVQKTKKFFISLQGLHKNSRYTNAEKFDASRFDSGISEYSTVFLPFGAGTRKCPGSGLTVTYGESLLKFLNKKYNIQVLETPIPKRKFLLEFASGRLLLKFKEKS